jgi:hypothetical protein
MRVLILIVVTIGYSINSSASYLDTIDVWTVKLNGKPIVNSNEVAILSGHPMMINLSTLSDTDTLEICYLTDHGSERQKWQYLIKDSNNSILDTFTNPIDSSVSKKNFQWRKNYVLFNVGYLRQLLTGKNITNIFVQFKPNNTTEQTVYLDKNICIISES